jgi:Protein of unknown function (DUF3429)
MLRRIAWSFAGIGIAIFTGLTLALLSPASHVRIPAIAAMVTFAAVVISHLGGIEGGLALREHGGDERMRAISFTLGVFPTLLAWGVFWLPTPRWQLGASIAIFVAVWVADLWLARRGLIPAWFVDLRTAATATVCVILGFALWLL